MTLRLDPDSSLQLPRSKFDVVASAPARRINSAGVPWAKRSLSQNSESQNVDWALCSLDAKRINMVNCCTTPSGKKICPTRITTSLSPGTTVYVVTATKGTIPGKIASNDALIMSPGAKRFQRGCSAVLDRHIGEFRALRRVADILKKSSQGLETADRGY